MAGNVREQVSNGSTEGIPFATADEAWIWAVTGIQSRLDGANVKGGMADITRPCEASDIFVCVRALQRDGKISGHDLRVLLLYGSYSVAPMMLGISHRAAVPFWRRGIDALSFILEQKGIICRQSQGGQDAG